MPKRKRPGMVIVVSGASGSGKSSLSRRLLETVHQAELSISFTTRPQRPGETDGVHYHFVDDAEFDRRIARDDFAEWAHVHGNRYGTSMSFLKKRLAAGVDVICDIDVQGGFALRERFGADSVLVFVLPPSMAELERRLRGRGTDSTTVIRKRLAAARREHERARNYDYLLVNEDFVTAAGTLADIVRAERARAWRMLQVVPGRLISQPRRKKP